MKTVPLADVLWTAANKFLSHDAGPVEPPYEYSCTAVAAAFGDAFLALSYRHPDASRFIASLGCDTASWKCFADHYDGAERQGARYMWLLLAMHVAEDERIMVEVSQ